MKAACRVVSLLANNVYKQFSTRPAVVNARLHDADVFTGVVAANLQVFVNGLIYGSTPGRPGTEHEIAGELREKLAKYLAEAPFDAEDVPVDWSEFQPRLLRALQHEFRRCGVRIRDQTARDPILTQLSLDGGVALKARQQSAVQTHTLRARWLFDGCGTYTELQQRSKQLLAWLSLVEGEQWDVESSTAPGAFQLGDYVHLTRPTQTGDGAPRHSLVFSNESMPSASQARRSREANDFLADLASARTSRLQAASLPASVRHCEELQLVGPVGRDDDGSVTHYGSLTWSRDGTPRIAVTAHLTPPRRAVIASNRGAAGAEPLLSRAKPAGRAERSAMPFQAHLEDDRWSKSAMVAASDAVLVQKLWHDPFRRLPRCQALTWRLFQLNVHWRGGESMLRDIMPHLLNPGLHPLYAGTGHSSLGLHWQSSAAEMFFDVSDADAKAMWTALYMALLEAHDEDTRSAAMLWFGGQSKRPQSERSRGSRDAALLYHIVNDHAHELGDGAAAGADQLSLWIRPVWVPASPVGDGIQAWLRTRHTNEADEAFTPSGLWMDGFVDTLATAQSRAAAGPPSVDPTPRDGLGTSEPDHFVYRINKRVAPFALVPQPLARDQEEWLRRRTELLVFHHAKVAARDGKVRTLDPPRCRFFQVWGCEQLLALEGLQPQRFTDGVGGMDCLPRTHGGRCLAIPLCTGGRDLSRCRDIERPVVPRIYHNEPQHHHLLRESLRQRLRCVAVGLKTGPAAPPASPGSDASDAPEADLIGGAPGSSAFPHFGVFPVVVPPGSDTGSDLQSEHEWRMELSVKSVWNGVRTLSEAASRINQLAAMFVGLEKEGWRLERPVQHGGLRLVCTSKLVEARFCVSNCVQFGVWPEIRRLGDDEGDRFEADAYLPYTQADLDMLTRHGLLQPGELDQVLDVQSAARAVALDELLRLLVVHARDHQAGAHISLEVTDDVLRCIQVAEGQESTAAKGVSE